MNTVRLSEIVLSIKPDLYHWLTKDELDSQIVLTYGLGSVKEDDLLEIIAASIEYNKKNPFSIH